jgi:branched-subunit amino acid transport protein AzlD
LDCQMPRLYIIFEASWSAPRLVRQVGRHLPLGALGDEITTVACLKVTKHYAQHRRKRIPNVMGLAVTPKMKALLHPPKASLPLDLSVS